MQRMGLPSLTDNCQKQRTSQYHHLFDKKIMNQENSLNHWESNFYRARHGSSNDHSCSTHCYIHTIPFAAEGLNKPLVNT